MNYLPMSGALDFTESLLLTRRFKFYVRSFKAHWRHYWEVKHANQ